MASTSATPIPGVEDDPAAESSLDPLLDPLLRGQSTGPSADEPEADPANTAPSRLGEVGELAREITENPIFAIVAQIHEEIQQLLRVHRDIYDGVELATDQVQDKRIEFLEEGPEVTAADFFFEAGLVFFIDSPLAAAILKKILKDAFRFAGSNVARLVSRTEKLKTLGPAVARMKTFKGGIEEFDQKIFKLRQLQNETFQASNLSQLRLKETDLLVKRHEAILQNSIDRVTHVQAAQRAEITGDKVKKLFEETHKIVEEHGIEYGLAAAKGIERAATKSEGGEEKTNEPSDEAHYSIGVQLKSLAQTHLRNMELYLGLAAADADLLQSISLVEPVLVPDCFNLLSEMLDALAHLKAKDEQPQNVKVDVMRAFEKLIWSLLLKEEIEKFLVPPEVRFMVPTSETEEPFITSSGPFPDRLKEYFRARFSTEATQREEDVLRQMVELADAFTKASEQQDPFTVTRLAFKHGSNSSGNG